MDHTVRRHVITLEVDPDLKRWLERKAAERLIEGRPHGERSVGAVLRDIVAEAFKSDVARKVPA